MSRLVVAGVMMLAGCAGDPQWLRLASVPAPAPAPATAPGSGSPTLPARATDKLVLTVVVAGDPTLAAALKSRLAGKLDLGAELHLAELPNRPAAAPATSDLAAVIAAARQAYVDADVPRCLELLAEDRHPALLAEGRRDEAARVLFWRLACEVAGQDDRAAGADARTFALQELPVPPDADVISPEVEARIAGAAGAAAARRAVRITASATARVMVDGRWRGCVTPCTLDLAEGDHVLAVEADGYLRASRMARITRDDSIDLALTAAPPELAAEQWTRRYAAGGQEGAESLRLLASAVRARMLVLLVADGHGKPRLRGALATDGQLAARAEAPWGTAQPRALLRDLLVRAHLMSAGAPLYKRPAFWIAVSAAAAVAAGITTAILFEPEVKTDIRFQP